MPRTMTGPLLAAALAMAVSPTRPAPAQAPEASSLEAFGELAVGVWEAEDARHAMEWGVGRRAVRSRSYARRDGGWSLVSEGMWYHDPESGSVRGVVVAIDMPVSLFRYRSEVRGDSIVHHLVALGPAGGRYVETWTFEGDVYRWRLEEERQGERQPVMGGAYRRVEAAEASDGSGSGAPRPAPGRAEGAPPAGRAGDTP